MQDNNTLKLEAIEEEDINFSFFEDGRDEYIKDPEETIEDLKKNFNDRLSNLARSTELPTINIAKRKEPAKKGTPKPCVPTKSIEPGLVMCEDSNVEESSFVEIEESISTEEKIKKLQAITLSAVNIDTVSLSDTVDNLAVTESIPHSLEEIKESMLDIGELINYDDKKEQRSVEIIQIKTESLGKSNLIAKWLTETFITNPITALFSMVHTALFSLVEFIGGLLKFILLVTVLTVAVYIAYAYKQGNVNAATDMAIKNYEIIKDILVSIFGDLSKAITPLLHK